MHHQSLPLQITPPLFSKATHTSFSDTKDSSTFGVIFFQTTIAVYITSWFLTPTIQMQKDVNV